MNDFDVLAEVSRRGIEILPDGDNLRLRGDLRRLDEALKERIRANKAQLLDHIRGGQAGRPLPLTEMQRAYLLGRTEHLDIGNTPSQVYHEIEGLWDLSRLERSFNELIAHHGALRSTFTPEGQQIEQPWQAVGPCRIAIHDLRGRPAAAQAAARAEIRDAMLREPLPLDRPPLIEAAVSLLDDDRMALHLRHDGLAVDGISMFILFRDWADLYHEPASAKAPPAAIRAAYLAALQDVERSLDYESARAYWLARLDSLPPPPDLPLQRRPAEITRPRFARHLATLAPAAWRGLKQRALQAGLTPTAMLAAAYAEVLNAWGAGRHFTLNITLANRLPVHPDIIQTIGNFSTVLLLEYRGDAADSFTARAAKLQAQLRQDIEHRQFSGIAVLRERDQRRSEPAATGMPYTFNCAIGYIDESLDGSAIDRFGTETAGVTSTPQVWLNVFVMEKSGSLVVELDEVEGLFPAGLVADLASAYQRLLERLAEQPEAWDEPRLDLLPDAQRARRAAVNQTDAPIPDELLHHAVLRQAAARPEAVAIRTNTAAITYRQLHQTAARIADWLQEQSVQPDELVAVLLPKGSEQIAAVLGVLMAGAAYLPIDPALPEARINWLLRDGDVRCVLTSAATPATAATATGCTVLAVDRLPADPPLPAEPAAPATTPDHLAYVIYTSGTTGQPKGVMISHRSAVNLVTDINRRFAAGTGDRWFGVSQLGFDLSVYDLFGALSAGGTLILPDATQAGEPAHWLSLATTAGATLWNSVPAIVEMLADHAASAGLPLPSSLRLVMMSGDRVPAALPARLRQLAPNLQMVALGGPTETTVWNICFPIGDLDPTWASIPYGKPIANSRYHVLNEELAPCPDWVRGMLYAAGAGLARGYWQDEPRTTEAFIRHPQTGERLYRTGDEGRYLPDGNIEILGRSDFQFKLNGYRIESGEIEAALTDCPGVAAAAVICRDDGTARQIVGYVVADRREAMPDLPAALQRQLAARLPDYMVPKRIVVLKALPLTANGKVDRRQLATRPPEDEAPPPPVAAAPDDGLETAIAELWRELLGIAAVAADDSFVRLGGDSLVAARLAGRLRKDFGVSVELAKLMRLETVGAMAAHVRSVKAGKEAAGGSRRR